MDQLHAKLLAYVVDFDGRLDVNYARKLFANHVISPVMLDAYDVKQNNFVPTTASTLYEFARNYYDVYQQPAPVDAIYREIIDSPKLNDHKRTQLSEDLNSIRAFDATEAEFQYVIDRVLDVYTSNKALEVMQRAAQTLKMEPLRGVEMVIREFSHLMNIQTVDDDSIDQTLGLSQFAQYLEGELNQTGGIMHGTVPYPYPEANALLGGMAPGELIVIAGPSGAGKSFIGHDIAFHAGVYLNMPVVCADREMLHPQNGLRFLSRQTQIPMRKLRNARARTTAEDKLLRAALQEYAALKEDEDPILFIPPKRCLNTAMIRNEIARCWGDRKPKLIIADYLTLFESVRRLEGWEMVKQVTHELKDLALHYACPVVTMAQINKRGEVQYATIRHTCDTLIILEVDSEREYKPPGPNEYIGIPGVIHCVVDKARNEAKNVQFSLEVEFATASVKGLSAHSRTAVGQNIGRDPLDHGVGDLGVPDGS